MRRSSRSVWVSALWLCSWLAAPPTRAAVPGPWHRPALPLGQTVSQLGPQAVSLARPIERHAVAGPRLSHTNASRWLARLFQRRRGLPDTGDAPRPVTSVLRDRQRARLARPPKELRRPQGIDFSGGATWLSSPVPEEHDWRFGATSFRKILYFELGSLGARLPAPILSPIIAAFIRQLVKLDLSPLELYKVLLGELDVEEVVRSHKGRAGARQAVEGSRVGRVLHEIKELVLVVDSEAEDLVRRADTDGDSALTVRELFQILGAESALESISPRMSEFVLLRSNSGDGSRFRDSTGETVRIFVMAPFLLGLERFFRVWRKMIREVEDGLDAQQAKTLRELDRNSDGVVTVDDFFAAGWDANLPAPLSTTLRSIVVTSSESPSRGAALACAVASGLRRAGSAVAIAAARLGRATNSVCEALELFFGLAKALREEPEDAVGTQQGEIEMRAQAVHLADTVLAKRRPKIRVVAAEKPRAARRGVAAPLTGESRWL